MTAELDQKPSVAFVGLGNMGWPMAGHLLAAQFPLVAVDVDAERQARFVAEVGGTGLSDPAQLTDVGAVVLMLPTSSVVHEALLGPDGLAPRLQAGTTIIDMSSSNPQDTRRLAEELAEFGLAVVDAPVSGGVARAIDGTLTIMLGSDNEDAAALATTVVGPLSNGVFRTGGIGTGHAMKALNNFLAGTAFVALTDAVLAGERWGLAPEIVAQVINTSTGRSFVSERVMPTILSGEFNTGFALTLLAKDVGIAQTVFDDAGLVSHVCNDVRDRLVDAESGLETSADHSRAFAFWRDQFQRQLSSSASESQVHAAARQHPA